MNYIFLIPKLSLAKSKSTKSHLKFPFKQIQTIQLQTQLTQIIYSPYKTPHKMYEILYKIFKFLTQLPLKS